MQLRSCLTDRLAMSASKTRPTNIMVIPNPMKSSSPSPLPVSQLSGRKNKFRISVFFDLVIS
jgi:hypothetical protein